jgi:thioredoxin reductase
VNTPAHDHLPLSDPGRPARTVDVLVIGAGPAGLAAAAGIAAAGAGTVEVIDREDEAGGIPRHCLHQGFRVREPGRRISGPAYARHWRERATTAGATLRTGVTATGWAGALTLDTTSGLGLERLTARAIVLATGARERPRTARLVPGSRPAGVFTTGELQQTIATHRRPVGKRAVVIGAEPVSYSAVQLLRRTGTEIAAMVTDQPGRQAPWSAAADARLRHRIPLLTDAVVTGVRGRGRLTGVTLRHTDGRTTTFACDTLVFTGDFIPDHELAVRGEVALDRDTRGPAVDMAFHTGRPGIFAVGNLLHAVEPAATAAREGVLVTGPVLRHLSGRPWPHGHLTVEVTGETLRWVTPNRVTPADPHLAPGTLTLRTARPLARRVTLLVSQDGHVLHRERGLRGHPANSSLHVSADWIRRADPSGGPIVITMDPAIPW